MVEDKNEDKRKWIKKVKRRAHRDHSSRRSDIPFFQSMLIIILVLLIGYLAFHFVFYLLEILLINY